MIIRGGVPHFQGALSLSLHLLSPWLQGAVAISLGCLHFIVNSREVLDSDREQGQKFGEAGRANISLNINCQMNVTLRNASKEELAVCVSYRILLLQAEGVGGLNALVSLPSSPVKPILLSLCRLHV